MSTLSEAPLYRLIITTSHINRLETALEDLGALSLFISSSGDMPFADPRQADQRYGNHIEALFDYAPDLTHIAAIDPQASCELQPVEALDWVSRSQENLPLISAPPYLIFGAHARPAHAARQYAIEVEAGAAFGSGHHATTQLCLQALAQQLRTGSIRRAVRGGRNNDHQPDQASDARQNARPRAAACLDLGCGSGILAMALAKSSTGRVIASDIDQQAVMVTRDNAARNGVASHIAAVTAAGFNHPTIRKQAPYGLIIANILAHPLCQLAPDFSRHSRAGSTVILSGLLRHQRQAVIARFRAAGFVLRSQLMKDEWACLTLTR